MPHTSVPHTKLRLYSGKRTSWQPEPSSLSAPSNSPLASLRSLPTCARVPLHWCLTLHQRNFVRRDFASCTLRLTILWVVMQTPRFVLLVEELLVAGLVVRYADRVGSSLLMAENKLHMMMSNDISCVNKLCIPEADILSPISCSTSAERFLS